MAKDVGFTITGEAFKELLNSSGFNSLRSSVSPPSEKTPLVKKEDQVSIDLSCSSSSSSESSESEPEATAAENDEGSSEKPAHEKKKVSNTGTMVHLLKANITTGLLAMPKALSNFGLLAGVLGILCIGMMFVLSIHLLFDISKGIARRIKMEMDRRQIEEVENVLSALAKQLEKKQKKEAKRKAKREKKENPEGWKVKYNNDFEVGNSSKQNDIPVEKSHSESESGTGQQNETGNEDTAQAPSAAPGSSVELQIPGQTMEILAKFISFSKENNDEIVDKIMRSLHYPKIVELSFDLGQKDMRWATKLFKFYVKMMLLLTHIGCCCVCFLFIAECLSEIPTTAKYVSHSGSFILLAYALPIMICLSFIPDRHELTGVATIASFLQISGIAMMLYIFLEGKKSHNYYPYVAPRDTWSLYFGIIFYAFEGTGLTLHLESHMENRKAFRGTTGVFNKTMVFMIFLFSFFGLFGYWKYGNDVKTSVSFNLPPGRFTDLAQFVTALGVLLTYPFHFSFVLTPVKKFLVKDECSGHMKQFSDLFLRALLVVFTYLLSAVIPYLELQISVLGATASCFLVLIVPSFMYINTFGELPGVKYTCGRLLFFFFVFLFGSAGTTLGAYQTIVNLPLYYPNGAIFG